MSYANAWSDVIRANWANVQLLIDMRTGSYQDLSDNARVVTMTPWAGTRPPQWLTQAAGKGMEMGGVLGGSGILTTPNTVGLNLNPSGTIMCFWRSEFPLWAGCRHGNARAGQYLTICTTVPVPGRWGYTTARHHIRLAHFLCLSRGPSEPLLRLDLVRSGMETVIRWRHQQRCGLRMAMQACYRCLDRLVWCHQMRTGGAGYFSRRT